MIKGTYAFAFGRPGTERLGEASILYARHCRAVSNLRVVDAALDVWMLEHGYRKHRSIWMSDRGVRQYRQRVAAVREIQKRIATAPVNGKAGHLFHVEHASIQ